jgi:hypothetical protein
MMPQQQIDPMAMVMQILQLTGQRRAQQAETEQGSRRLDLQEMQLQQQGDQFNQGLGWDREQFQGRMGMDQKRLGFDEQKMRAELERQALMDPAQRAVWKAQVEQYGRPDPQAAAVAQAEKQMIDNHLRSQLNMLDPKTIEYAKIRDRLDELYGIKLRPDTPDEARQRQAYGQIQQ